MVFWIYLRLSIYQDFKSIRNLNMLEIHRVYWEASQYNSGSEYGGETTLKLVSAIFDQIFIFNQMIALQKLWKMFFIHLKSSFRSWDIQVFVFPSSPHFLPVSHCVRGCLKINLKVYDVINCLSMNLIKYFVWYLGKEKRYDIETLCIDRVLNKEHFYGKIMQKMGTKS